METTLPDAAFWFIAVLSGLVSYLSGHQSSHIVAVRGGEALNPVLLLALGISQWLVWLQWAFLIWYGYKTVWWYAVGAVAVGFIFRLVLTKIQMVTGLTKSAWAISLIGILIIPLGILATGIIVEAI